MDEVTLFPALAQIAGIFVGFGALIGVSRKGEVADPDLVRTRVVVGIGLVGLLSALIPVALSQYDLDADLQWRISAALFLGLIWATFALGMGNTFERERLRIYATSESRFALLLFVLLEPFAQVPLFLTIAGYRPRAGGAFYATAVIVNIFQAAIALAQLVQSESDTE